MNRRKFKHSLKVLSTLSKTNIKDCHVQALLDVVQYTEKFMKIEKSDIEGHLKVTYKYDFGDNGPKLGDVLNGKF